MKLFSRTPSVEHDAFFDALEPRLALYAAPFLTDFPDIGEMANPQNTVVRMQTTAGIIDIELFDRAGPNGATAAPITTANFLRYIHEGHYDQTFFHRVINDPDPFVIQGGAYRFDVNATPRATTVPTFDAIKNEFDPGRSNLTGTIAMAKLPNNPDSATNQFFFNLNDNSQNLDNQNGGFTVFGRVISGWDIVMDMSSVEARNLINYLDPGTPANQSPFGGVPTTGPEQSDLLFIVDIDVIKPATSDSFYDHALFFPEGYRSGNSTMSIDVVNLDSNTKTFYEVIARFETGARDIVVTTGSLAPGAHKSIPLFEAQNPELNTIRGGAPFALELRATNRIAASVDYTDFGGQTSQAFINPRGFEAEDLHEWNFSLGVKGVGRPSYLVWQNISDEPATVTITFHHEAGGVHELVRTADSFRRDGLNVNQLSFLADGAYAVSIVADQPIVAAMSQYRASPSQAAIETGAIRGGGVQGVLPGAIIPSGPDGQSILSVALADAASGPVIVDFEFVRADGSILSSPALFTLDSNNRRAHMDLSVTGVPVGEFFTMRYTVRDNAAPVSATFLSLVNGQTMRSTFQTASSQKIYFAGGYTNPDSTEGAEYLSIYNPHLNPNVTVTYQLRFHFVDDPEGTIVFAAGPGATGQIGAGQSVHIPVRELENIMSRITSDAKFRNYAVSVVTTITDDDANEREGAVFGQFTRIDNGGRTAISPAVLSDAFPNFFLDNDLIFRT